MWMMFYLKLKSKYGLLLGTNFIKNLMIFTHLYVEKILVTTSKVE